MPNMQSWQSVTCGCAGYQIKRLNKAAAAADAADAATDEASPHADVALQAASVPVPEAAAAAAPAPRTSRRFAQLAAVAAADQGPGPFPSGVYLKFAVE